jgi:hypothetical protein
LTKPPLDKILLLFLYSKGAKGPRHGEGGGLCTAILGGNVREVAAQLFTFFVASAPVWLRSRDLCISRVPLCVSRHGESMRHLRKQDLQSQASLQFLALDDSEQTAILAGNEEGRELVGSILVAYALVHIDPSDPSGR